MIILLIIGAIILVVDINKTVPIIEEETTIQEIIEEEIIEEDKETYWKNNTYKVTKTGQYKDNGGNLHIIHKIEAKQTAYITGTAFGYNKDGDLVRQVYSLVICIGSGE